MAYKKLTNFLVFFFMLAGVALMAYGEIERMDLEKSEQIETVKTKSKQHCSKKNS